jgi:hypothetical protein
MAEYPADGTLSQALQDRLEANHWASYQLALSEHFRLWKFHRRFDQRSAAFIRRALYQAKMLRLCEQPGWKIDRGVAEIDAVLGGVSDSVREECESRYRGEEDPDQPIRMIDSGPGNFRGSYERSNPCLCVVGFGNEILFNVEGTLRNCLKRELYAEDDGRQPVWLSAVSSQLHSLAEVASVAEFVLCMEYGEGSTAVSDSLNQFAELAPNPPVIEGAEMLALRQSILRSLQREPRIKSAETTIPAMMLGFLIDELVARSFVPNGMRFSYPHLEILIQSVLASYADLSSVCELTSQGAKATEVSLSALLELLFADGESRRPLDSPSPDAIAGVIALAEDLRAAARRFVDLDRSRALDPKKELIYDLANWLWKWVLFVQQRSLMRGRNPTFQERRDFVCDCLRCGWAILDMKDIKRAFTGFVKGDEHDEIPRAFTKIVLVMRENVSAFMVETFGAEREDDRLESLRRFVARRVTIANQRRSTARVTVDPKNAEYAKKAGLFIDLFSAWLFTASGSSSLRSLGEEFSEIVDLLRLGHWAANLESTAVPLTNTGIRLLKSYCTNPKAFLTEYFRFDEDGFDLREELYVFPMEEMQFFSI